MPEQGCDNVLAQEVKDLKQTFIRFVDNDFHDFKIANQEAHKIIDEKVSLTNGNVKALKEWRGKVEGFISGASKSISIGWLVFIFLIGTIVAPYFFYYLNHKGELTKEEVQQLIAQEIK